MRALLIGQEGQPGQTRVILNNMSLEGFLTIKAQNVRVILDFELEEDRRAWGRATIDRFLPLEEENSDE